MSAPEQPQGVLLRYAGGTVYALPTADRHVWRVAGVEVHVDMVVSTHGTGEVMGAETPHSLAYAVEIRHRVAAERERIAAKAAEAAEHARVALEMERTPKRPAKRTGKAKRVAKRTGKGRAKR